MTAEAEVKNTISQAWSAANAAQSQASSFASQAASGSFLALDPDIHEVREPDKPDLLQPPTVDLGALFDGAYDGSLQELQTVLDNRLQEFLDEYYPDYTSNLKVLGDYITNAIQNGGTGLPAHIEHALWERGRARLALEATAAESQVFDTFASRGFPLPPGMAVERVEKIRQEHTNRSADLNREVMIKQAELEVDNIQRMVQVSSSLHIGIIQAATNYMNAIINVASHANARAAALVSAINTLYQMNVAYNQAAIASERLILDYDTTKASVEVQEYNATVDTLVSNAQANKEAALGAARAMGDLAAAAIASQNTMATIAHETNATE